jgi:hypothetical protein
MYPTADHCYSQTMSTGEDISWMISTDDYTHWKLYMDTIVDNTCIDVVPNNGDVVSNDGDDDDDNTVDDDSTGDATCGECLSIMGGDKAYITARLWKMNVPAASLTLDIIASAFSSEPGFIKYTAAATQDPYVFLFYDVFDTEENSEAAYQKAEEAYGMDSKIEELLHTFTGEI